MRRHLFSSYRLLRGEQVVREGSKRVLGLRPFDVQLIGGMILHNGEIAEMRTGEGKTLVAVLPAYLNALAGKGVQVGDIFACIKQRGHKLRLNKLCLDIAMLQTHHACLKHILHITWVCHCITSAPKAELVWQSSAVANYYKHCSLVQQLTSARDCMMQSFKDMLSLL